MPRRTLADPEIAALAKCFAHNDGVRVMPDTSSICTSAPRTKPAGLKGFPKAT